MEDFCGNHRLVDLLGTDRLVVVGRHHARERPDVPLSTDA